MRTIKFRGKSKRTDEWLCGDLVHSDDGRTFIYPLDCEGLFLKNEVDTDTVGQFTGLYDSKGKEIYEGDIIKSCLYRVMHYVNYNEDEASYVATIVGPSIIDYCSIRQSWIDKFKKEVIGNIYDNPELLKQ